MAALLLTWLLYLLDWRSVLIVFLLLNLKNVPLSWHARALYCFLRARPRQLYTVQHSSSPSNSTKSPSQGVQLLFGPATISTQSPILESDFNYHKSNSTYFSDLDISLLKLMTRVYFAGFSKCSKELTAEGYNGRMSFTLGSVYCSFRRPLRPYNGYQVSSRVLTWDQKWIYIVSWFSRDPKGKGQTEIIACALSKYVCQKGRFTVPPERLLGASGLLLSAQGAPLKQASPSALSSAIDVVDRGRGRDIELRESLDLRLNEPRPAVMSKEEEQWGVEIEIERLRGMDVAKAFISLDNISFSEVAQSVPLGPA